MGKERKHKIGLCFLGCPGIHPENCSLCIMIFKKIELRAQNCAFIHSFIHPTVAECLGSGDMVLN